MNDESTRQWKTPPQVAGYHREAVDFHRKRRGIRPAKGAFGIDYALIAMFICLLIYQIRKLIHLLTSVIAGLTAVGLGLVIPGNSYIVIASIAAATVGVIIQRRVMRSNPICAA